MTKRKIKTISVEKLIGAIWSIVGVVMVLVGIVIICAKLSFMNGADKISGTVSDMAGGNRSGTEITYTYEGKEYVKWISFTTSAWREGDEAEIYVDRKTPDKIEPAGYMFMAAYIVGGIGIFFVVFGMVFLAVSGKKGKKKKRLLNEGRKIYAEVTGGQINYNYRVNGRHPYKLECRYTDTFTGAVYLFRSDNTWLDPNAHIGRQVAVYVDAADMSRYHVDVESLNGDAEYTTNVYDYR